MMNKIVHLFTLQRHLHWKSVIRQMFLLYPLHYFIDFIKFVLTEIKE